MPDVLSVRAAACAVALRIEDAGLRRRVASLFAAMVADDATDVIAHITVRRAGRLHVVSCPGEDEVVETSQAAVLWRLRHLVSVRVMNARPDLLWFHAAGVASHGRAILIAGPGASGKSTLAVGLARQGFSFIGDDLIAIEPSTLVLHELPITPSVRRHVPSHLMFDEVRVQPKADVPVDAHRSDQEPATPALLVFPSFSSDETELAPMLSAAAALELLLHS